MVDETFINHQPDKTNFEEILKNHNDNLDVANG